MNEVAFFEKMISTARASSDDVQLQCDSLDDQLKAVSENWNLRYLYGLYMEARKTNAPCVVFNDFFHDRDIDPMCGFLEMAGINQIALASTSTALMDNLFEFKDRGWEMLRLEDVPVNHVNWTAKGIRKYETRHAIILEKRKQ